MRGDHIDITMCLKITSELIFKMVYEATDFQIKIFISINVLIMLALMPSAITLPAPAKLGGLQTLSLW